MHDLEFEHRHPSDEEKEQLAEIIWSNDNVELTTVGLDVGSSTTHLMFARVHLQRLSEALSSRFVVVSREILWKSPIQLTRYRPDDSIDAEWLAAFVEKSYLEANIERADVDSGAVILTGEALKRRNAKAIADLFSAESGKFVCASAGHHLESLMAAQGSGAVALSRTKCATVLNIDIGGGTTKLALVQDGKLLHSAAFAVGSRLIAIDSEGIMTRVESPAWQIAEAAGVSLKTGALLGAPDRKRLVAQMTEIILENVHRGPPSVLAQALMLTDPLPRTPEPNLVTFSGGVSEYIFKREAKSFGDLGPSLARSIVHALEDGRLPWPVFDPGQGIRATVIGASQFSVQVSGNTIYVSDPGALPIRNAPVAHIDRDLSGPFDAASVTRAVRKALDRIDAKEGEDHVALAFKWADDPLHARLFALAKGLCDGLPNTIANRQPMIMVMEGDIARALGQILRNELSVAGAIISIDGVQLQEFDYVDIGEIIKPSNVVPIVIKSLLFSTDGSGR